MVRRLATYRLQDVFRFGSIRTDPSRGLLGDLEFDDLGVVNFRVSSGNGGRRCCQHL